MKGGIIVSAISGGFQEGKERCYTFQETTEDTLVRFIEWLYRSNYSDAIPLFLVSNDMNQVKNSLLANIKLYIFADTYSTRSVVSKSQHASSFLPDPRTSVNHAMLPHGVWSRKFSTSHFPTYHNPMSLPSGLEDLQLGA